MANQYRWPTDNKLHSIPYSVHVQHLAAQSPNITPFSQAQVSQGPGMPTTSVTDYAQQQQAALGGPPPDPNLIAQQNAANRNIAVGNAWDQYSLGQIENQFGLGVDVSNPFSRAKLLQDQYQRNQTGTQNSYASQGQIYSGSYLNAKNSNARNYAIQDDALRREYQARKDALTKGKLDRYSQVGASLSDAELQSLIAQIGR